MLRRVPVTRNGRFDTDTVPEEGFFLLKINDLGTTVVISPKDVKEFCHGYLLTEGFISSLDDVRSYRAGKRNIAVRVKESKDARKKWLKLVKTDCCQDVDHYWEILDEQRDLRLSPMNIPLRTLDKILGTVDRKAISYRSSGATHSAGIFEEDGTNVVFTEDIGRHNAVDKVIGHCLIHGISLEDKILFTTGRISTALMLKVIRARIPALVSLTAPMSNSVKLAKDFGRTLVGFLKRGSAGCSVYNGRLLST